MKLTLNRKFKGQTYTIGDLSIDGKFFCNTIEDAVRELPATRPDISTSPYSASIMISSLAMVLI